MVSSLDILSAPILIVDDQPANVALLLQMLRGAGYTSISSTMNPHEVCKLHRQNRYSLILLDLQMPGKDGFQVMEELKSIEVNCYLPVLVITAQPDHKLRALKAGAKDFVSKPFDLAEVLMRVHNLLEVRLLHIAAEARTEKAEGLFIESQKMDAIGQLAAGVAHDFNNIIAVIMGYSEMLMQKVEFSDEIRGNLETIRAAGERAAGLTRQLLIFSRKQEVQLVVLDLNEVVRGLDKILRRLIHENIVMTIVPDKYSGRVKADSGYIGQILINLVVNARDAMPHGGCVTIATKNVTLDRNYTNEHAGVNPGEYVMLSVSDTGTGMTAEVMAHMFEALFTTKPKGEGTGLGLAICQTIVQQAGGHIGVYSEVGVGTTFKIYFPLVLQPLDTEFRPIQSGPVPRGTETLLVVEDEPSVRHLARGALEAQGYQVLSAPNGQDALETAREHKGSPIRLVVTDVIMPVMGGKVMAEWLKTIYPDLKILFTSGYTDEAILHHGVLQPGVEFMPKPYTPSMLARKVRTLLDQPAVSTINHAPASNGDPKVTKGSDR
jgi:two-component system, cell cycle sensor histidine kinase and response regulator CckA